MAVIVQLESDSGRGQLFNQRLAGGIVLDRRIKFLAVCLHNQYGARLHRAFRIHRFVHCNLPCPIKNAAEFVNIGISYGT